MDLPNKRVYIAGLLVGCPYKSEPAGCALYDIRKKPLKERIEWCDQLTDEQIQDILNVHKKCLAQREGKKNAAEEQAS